MSNAAKTIGRVLTTVGAVLVVVAAIWGYVGDYVNQLLIWLPFLIGGVVLMLIGVLLLRGRGAAAAAPQDGLDG
jgi:hypothetical protein